MLDDMIIVLGRIRKVLMRTTLDIDEDVLLATKELAKRERKTAGKLVSELVREALLKRASGRTTPGRSREFYGFRPISAGGAVVTNELVDKLREELEV